MRTILLTLLLTQIFSHVLAQNISSADYPTPFVQENFDNQNSLYFATETNQENYINTDNNTLFLIRKNTQTPYFVFAKHNLLEDFIIKTELRIGPSENKQASIGVILKAQQNVDSGIIFEINKRGEYRIRQKTLNGYENLGEEKEWKKSKLINRQNKRNIIEIRSENNIYDVYINHNFLTSFKSFANKNGITGIFINHNTKAKVSYFNINTKKRQNPTINKKTIISQLNQKVQDLTKENLQLRTKIKTFSNKDRTVQKNKSNENQQNIKLLKENESLEYNIPKKINNLTQSHTKVKEVIIKEAFERNGINPSQIIKRTSQVKKLKNNTIYTVQIGVFMQEKQGIESNTFWSKATELGTYIYYSGKFKSAKEAVLHLNNLILNGYKNAFVITLNK